ncbi:MAG: hypothetical protein A2X64_00420 [Ignavibacteria bacterium GWF2_33_9]|nr:MAG: hypothetical protein A2X64_00420 [Ignavibacteria bacterium GWF2_33_9]
MKKLTIIINFIILLCLTSCGYIQYSYNKIIYIKEYNFIKNVIEYPENADSLIINSTYYDKSNFEKYQENCQRLRLLRDNWIQHDPPKITRMYINKNYRPAFTNYDNKLLSVEVNRNMTPGYQTIIFLFTKIDNQMKLVDILWVVM